MNSEISIRDYNKIIESIHPNLKIIAEKHNKKKSTKINKFNIIKFINNLKFIIITKNLENSDIIIKFNYNNLKFLRKLENITIDELSLFTNSNKIIYPYLIRIDIVNKYFLFNIYPNNKQYKAFIKNNTKKYNINTNYKIFNKYIYFTFKIINDKIILYPYFNIFNFNNNDYYEHKKPNKKTNKYRKISKKVKKNNNKNKNYNNRKNKKEDKNKNNNNNNLINNNNILDNINYNYINEILYNKFISKENIMPNEIDVIDVEPDGNCYMRCISLFVYHDENEHHQVRNEISNYLYTNFRNYENIPIPTEEGPKEILDNIAFIRKTGKWSGNLEFDASNKVYHINLLVLYTILDINFNVIKHKYAYKFCYDNNLPKDLCIISNYANSHYKLIFLKIHKVYKINSNLIYNYENNTIINTESILDNLPILNNNINNKKEIYNISKNNNFSLNNNNNNKNTNDDSDYLNNNIKFDDNSIYHINIELNDFKKLEFKEIILKYKPSKKNKLC